MVHDLMGWEFDLGFSDYGEKWREERRMFSKEFTEKTIKQFRPLQTKAINQLIRELTKTPERWSHHVHQSVINHHPHFELIADRSGAMFIVRLQRCLWTLVMESIFFQNTIPGLTRRM